MTLKHRLWTFGFVTLGMVIGASCVADPKVVVPDDFHGPVSIMFCMSGKGTAPFFVGENGEARSSVCTKTVTKFAIKRRDGEAINISKIDIMTTGDGIVVGAKFNVP